MKEGHRPTGCWECNRRIYDEPRYGLSLGTPGGEWQKLGYFCCKDCLSFWITEHWDDL